MLKKLISMSIGIEENKISKIEILNPELIGEEANEKIEFQHKLTDTENKLKEKDELNNLLIKTLYENGSTLNEISSITKLDYDYINNIINEK